MGEVIRGNTANQTLFSAVMMQTNPPRPIIVILLMSMINDKQPFHLRCSILYCFECFLYRNEAAKANIIDTLLPKEQSMAAQQAQQITSGQILCTGLLNQNDYYSNWYCAVAMAHAISENTELKEQLLRVQLAINQPNSSQQSIAVSLMQQCINILIESTNASHNNMPSQAVQIQAVPNRYNFQTTVSILMFLSTWLSSCPVAVNMFLSQSQNIPYVNMSFFVILNCLMN